MAASLLIAQPREECWLHASLRTGGAWTSCSARSVPSVTVVPERHENGEKAVKGWPGPGRDTSAGRPARRICHCGGPGVQILISR